MGDPFEALSLDLFRAVLLRCDNAALVRAGCVSRRWRSVSREATVLTIYKNQRVMYINGRSRWDWDCILFHVDGSKSGRETTPDASPKTTLSPSQKDGVITTGPQKPIHERVFVAEAHPGCRLLCNESFERLFPGSHTFGSLSVLLLHQCHLLSDETLAAVVRRCPNLKKLGLTGIAGPATLGALATVSESRLEVLELAHSAKVGDSDVLPLLAACPRLRRCNLRGCKGVSAAAYNAVAKELYSRLAADGVPVPSEFYYLKR
ncbi:hypothetical protein KFL_001040080 [Klebsormidium nitens]|uniref:F-box domain-containing protein n=1 Tax=Klebsormidium nitens TaxID=105231 RepID=A0A1Y1HU96_KLENI|nr:hypothetical protein KFL_001040080 [Klebsormidium nitens]|eukprot:GAQ82205.1 hypothetical protein KFL_001040080 [Klebsormidium nitens]